jgi:homospermidine synthase
MKKSDLFARFDGPIVLIGFGSIGKGTLPLIERHLAFDREKFVVIAPDDSDRRLLDERRCVRSSTRHRPSVSRRSS